MKIIVVGAGIVGLATAWRLQRDGHNVTVMDRDSGPGLGTSYANGAQLSYSYVAPLAGPSVWAQLPRFLTDRNSPVQFRPGLDPFQYRWLLQFIAACTRRQALATVDRLGELAELSRQVLHGSPSFWQGSFTGQPAASWSFTVPKRASRRRGDWRIARWPAALRSKYWIAMNAWRSSPP